MQKFGLFGGTFNPIHLGHLRVAEEVREGLQLDRVFFIPSADPPHKDKAKQNIVAIGHRLEMCRLAIQDHSAFALCDFEATRAEKSYSLYTIQYFQQQHPQAELYFIIGADAFAEITTWHRWEEVLANAHFVVMTRPGHDFSTYQAALPVAIASRYQAISATIFSLDSGSKTIFQQVTGLDIAGRDIRHRLKQSNSVRYLVTDTVYQYIQTHHLYR